MISVSDPHTNPLQHEKLRRHTTILVMAWERPCNPFRTVGCLLAERRHWLLVGLGDNLGPGTLWGTYASAGPGKRVGEDPTLHQRRLYGREPLLRKSDM